MYLYTGASSRPLPPRDEGFPAFYDWLKTNKAEFDNVRSDCTCSQGWASGVLLQSMYVVCLVYMRLGFWVSFFSFLASVLYTFFHVSSLCVYIYI